MKKRFKIYEIEHQGDVQESIDDLHQAGCTDVKVEQTDYDEESMVVVCVLPEGVTQPDELKLEYACL